MESGVNLLHELRCQRGRYRGAGNAVIVAVVVNSLTTMVGFGALMIANHQGLQSLGRVLTISMGCCMLNALLLPNLLVIGRFAPIIRRPTTKTRNTTISATTTLNSPNQSSVSFAAYPGSVDIQLGVIGRPV